MMKFSLVTLKKSIQPIYPKFGFFLEKVSEINNSEQIIRIDPNVIFKINPNTHNIPTIKNRFEYELLQKIHKNSNILLLENGSDQSKISIWGEMFNMTRAEKKLASQIIGSEDYYSTLIESKMILQYDHRYATFANLSTYDIENGNALECHYNNKLRSEYQITSRYFIKKKELLEKLKKKGIVRKWLLGFRSIASPTNERTCIGSILPLMGTANSINLILIDKSLDAALLLSLMNSVTCDFATRLKVGNQNFNIFIMKQLPILFSSYQDFKRKICDKGDNVIPIILELTYTAWDIKAFADDLWQEADADLRSLIQIQWDANRSVTGGHTWNPPEWAEITEDGIPLPPFKWDEDRRAVLRAELDALYAKLYGLTYDELRYILDPQDVYGPDYPGETFRVLKEKEIKKYGEYRTRRLVLEAWERMEGK